MKPPSIRDVVKAHLLKHGYDGLVREGTGCYCSISCLMTCANPYPAYCVAGTKVDGRVKPGRAGKGQGND